MHPFSVLYKYPYTTKQHNYTHGGTSWVGLNKMPALMGRRAIVKNSKRSKRDEKDSNSISNGTGRQCRARHVIHR